MKKLITATTIEKYVGSHKKVFPVDNNTIISPAARDVAHTYKIKFVSQEEYDAAMAEEAETKAEESKPAPEPVSEKTEAPAPCCCDELTTEQIVAAVIKVLDAKGILDKIMK